MNKIISIIRANVLLTVALAIWGASACLMTSCTDDDVPTNLYSSNKMTAAEVIMANNAKYSSFRTILERANYMSMLATYGTYTVFVPNNDAIQAYLTEHGYSSLDKLSKETCDTLARTHIVRTKAMFTTDISSESMPMNMNDRSLELSTDSDATNNNALVVYVNKRSRLVAYDDSTTNGVVHEIDHVIVANNELLGGLIAADSTLSIFSAAIEATGMAELLLKSEDETYHFYDKGALLDDPERSDSVSKGVMVNFGTNTDNTAKKQNAKYPAHRYFRYTAFVEPDAVFNAAGIYKLSELQTYAKQIYDLSYPEDAGLYDAYPTHPKNPLNRFVRYHFIDRDGLYEDWVPCQTYLLKNYLLDKADPEDYYEAMLEHSIMRFCYANDELYINRKGVGSRATVRGVRVLKREESGQATQECKNGRYHYIDRILTYDKDTRDNTLQCRMRIDGTTLSPDFMNAGARMHHMGDDSFMMGFKKGYVTNFDMKNDKTFVGVRPEIDYWWHYQGNAVAITGAYDVAVKLPPVSKSGTYEIRLGYSTGADRGVAQVYLNNEACGIPVDFRVGDPGNEADDPEDEEFNKALDKAMRNRDFMKAMDSYGGDEPFRNRYLFRRILYRGELKCDQDNWLRFRQVLDNEKLYMSLDYLEIVPKVIYDDPNGEDRH